MKFTANEDFKVKAQLFEQGNSYSAERYGITEEALRRYWSAGWCEVEGWDKAPDRKPGARKLEVQNVTVQNHG